MSVSDRTIDSHIKRIRRKFSSVDPTFAAIEGVYGAGYRYSSGPCMKPGFSAWRASGIGLRLLAFNVLVVFVPIVGVLYLDVYEDRLLETQERAMVQQARLLAAAVSGPVGIDGATAQGILNRVGGRNDARLRVFDAHGRLVADSARAPSRPEDEAPSAYDSASSSARGRVLYRVGAMLARIRSLLAPLVRSAFRLPESGATVEPSAPAGAELQAALAGRYGAATRRTPGQRSLTLYSAVPVRHADVVVGAVIVSQSTFRILQALYHVRLRIFQVVVASLAVAALLTMVAATTIVRPLTRLRRAAASLAERRRLPQDFPGTGRRDEIGEMARALEDLTRRLSAHIALLEGFAADVSHEFKNPLAGIRSAAETIEACDAVERSRFVALMLRDIERLERLVSSLRELASIDGRLEQVDTTPVNLDELLRTVVDGVSLRAQPSTRIIIRSEGGSCRVSGDIESLTQVFENLLTNAVSFAPEGSAVEVHLGRDARSCRVRVEDRGSGIPEAHLERVFESVLYLSPGRRTPGTSRPRPGHRQTHRRRPRRYHRRLEPRGRRCGLRRQAPRGSECGTVMVGNAGGAQDSGLGARRGWDSGLCAAGALLPEKSKCASSRSAYTGDPLAYPAARCCAAPHWLRGSSRRSRSSSPSPDPRRPVAAAST